MSASDYCSVCWEEFHDDDTGGYSPSCRCGLMCRDCCKTRCDQEELGAPMPDDAEPKTIDLMKVLTDSLKSPRREDAAGAEPFSADERLHLAMWVAANPKIAALYKVDRLLAALSTAERERDADAARLDDIEWFGCNTGDCPHSKQSECDVALLGVVRSVLAERASQRPLAAEKSRVPSGGEEGR